MNLKRVVLLAAMFSMLYTAIEAEIPYRRYCNARFAYCLDYPARFTMEAAPVNNDGRTFYDEYGGMEMEVYGTHNALESTLSADMRETAGEIDRVTYKKMGRNWFVLSGYSGRNIVYIKKWLHNDEFYVLQMIYPVSAKKIYDKIVTRISRSFGIAR